jgi:hypothetical protein
MNMTPQEKKLYLINNIEKYVIDSRENFFHIDPDMLGDERVYIGKNTFTPEDYKEIGNEMTKRVVEKKED